MLALALVLDVATPVVAAAAAPVDPLALTLAPGIAWGYVTGDNLAPGATAALQVDVGYRTDEHSSLVAATTGLELAPRDPDLLRSQATALAALGRPEAPAALAAYDRFRSPDNSAELRIQCAGDSSRCAREREQGHTHVLHLVR